MINKKEKIENGGGDIRLSNKFSRFFTACIFSPTILITHSRALSFQDRDHFLRGSISPELQAFKVDTQNSFSTTAFFLLTSGAKKQPINSRLNAVYGRTQCDSFWGLIIQAQIWPV